MCAPPPWRSRHDGTGPVRAARRRATRSLHVLGLSRQIDADAPHSLWRHHRHGGSRCPSPRADRRFVFAGWKRRRGPRAPGTTGGRQDGMSRGATPDPAVAGWVAAAPGRGCRHFSPSTLDLGGRSCRPDRDHLYWDDSDRRADERCDRLVSSSPQLRKGSSRPCFPVVE